MTHAYKKRAKASWNQGKGAKGDSEERQYSRREVREQLAQAEETYLHHHHKGARTRNEKARLEYRVSWYEQRLERWAKLGTSDSMLSYFRSELRRAQKELAEKFPEAK